MLIRSLGWDPRHHEELRKSPENKIHIRKVVFGGVGKVREFSVRVPEVSTRFRKVLEWGPPDVWGPHGPRGGAAATWASRTSPIGPCGRIGKGGPKP